MLIYFHGNCQARALSQMIAPVFPEWQVEQYEVFTDNIVAEIDRYKHLVTTADIIVTQPIHSGYRDREELSLDWVKANAKSGIPVVVFPSMYFDGQLIGYSALTRPTYEMEHHDIFLLKLVVDGFPETEIIRRLLSPALYDSAFISAEIARAITEMARREVQDNIDVLFSPFLQDFAYETQLFHTVNHPFRATLAWMGNRILRHLGYDREIPVLGRDHIWYPHLPCCPAVIRYFGSRYSARPSWMVDEGETYHLKEGYVSRAEYISRAVTFLRTSPSGDLEACIQDPRTERFLTRLEKGMPGALINSNVPDEKTIVSEPNRGLLPSLDNTVRQLMMNFESLGGAGHGCEFGLLQREFGAEPLGLLRWADLGPDQLTAALANSFEGVGEEVNTEIFRPDDDVWNEWWTRDKRYWMVMRAFYKVDDVTHDEMQRITLKRHSFLRDKLLQDLRNGKKIFVYKNMYNNLSNDELNLLHATIRKYGDNVLLYIQYEDTCHPSGTVKVVAPGLLIGYINHFGYSRNNEPISSATTAYLEICRRAFELWTAGHAREHDKGGIDHPISFSTIDHGLELANIAVERGDPETALQICDVVRSREPGHSGAYLLMAQILGKLGLIDKAEAIFQAGLLCCPQDVSLYVGHAFIPQRAGELNEACRRWEIAYKQFPRNDTIAKNYVTVLELLGQHDSATGVRTSAVQLLSGQESRLTTVSLN